MNTSQPDESLQEFEKIFSLLTLFDILRCLGLTLR